ncbi:Uncharacterised protein [Mycobacteroides abscessus subsp. abscessus]|uniref:hypothetical protein n=1 Tax=Mycobacteroides abscessus TaxID=36809 RepID=UPI0009A5A8CE|nr:hypothetical protein [Mycobacteroides abscessus]SKR42648.1 Uncharacterised protein [Mycobacteroides abscessus subsp. abscessus]
MTVIATEAPAAAHTCPDCRHTQHVEAVAAGLDPDRLADRVRAELRNWSSDEVDPDVARYGDGRELAVDVPGRRVSNGRFTRNASEQLHLALVHMAAALAAGAKL